MSSKHIEKIEQKSLLRPLCKLLKFRDTLIVVLLPTGAKTGDLIEDSKTWCFTKIRKRLLARKIYSLISTVYEIWLLNRLRATFTEFILPTSLEYPKGTYNNKKTDS